MKTVAVIGILWYAFLGWCAYEIDQRHIRLSKECEARGGVAIKPQSGPPICVRPGSIL